MDFSFLRIFAVLGETQTEKIHLSDLASEMSRHKLGTVLFTSTSSSSTSTSSTTPGSMTLTTTTTASTVETENHLKRGATNDMKLLKPLKSSAAKKFFHSF